jgi:tRNA threonylcarbamoyladenosine biosynthesis protein TsaB
MERILQIETATEVCSVALAESGNLIALREFSEGKSHAAILSVFINEIFKETGILISSLDAVAVSMGPGSYTGLRIGVSVAKGLCFGLEKPLIAVPTLESMFYGMKNILEIRNYNFNDSDIFIPMIDARRLEVYMAKFDLHGNQIEQTSAKIIEPNSFNNIPDTGKIFFFGSGSDKLIDIITHKNAVFNADFAHSSVNMNTIALSMFRLKKFVDSAYFEPLYLKDFISTIPKKKLVY